MPDIPVQISPPSETERRQRLAAAIAGARPEFFVPLPDGLARLPVVRVPAGFPAYRVDNGRLIAELHEHARSHGTSLEALQETADSAGTQGLLHALLIDHASDRRGPIRQELKRLAQQTEPLLIGADGVVLNGNRRLAAMRSLLAEDPDRFAGFAEVSVAVLPAGLSAADLEYVEAALQMAPETKLAYGWINRRLKLRRQIEVLKLPRERVLAAYQMAEPDQLDRELAELALAEEYLSRHLGQPGHYAAIAEDEALFVALNAQLSALPEALRPVWTGIGFAMIHAQGVLDGAFRSGFPFARPQPPQLPALALRRFARDRLSVPAQETDRAFRPEDPLLQDLQLFFDGGTPEDVAPLRDLLEVMRVLREELAEAARPDTALQRIRQTRHHLHRLTPDRLSDEQRSALRGEMAALLAQTNYLLGVTDQSAYEQSKTTMVKAVSSYLRRWRGAGAGH